MHTLLFYIAGNRVHLGIIDNTVARLAMILAFEHRFYLAETKVDKGSRECHRGHLCVAPQEVGRDGHHILGLAIDDVLSRNHQFSVTAYHSIGELDTIRGSFVSKQPVVYLDVVALDFGEAEVVEVHIGLYPYAVGRGLGIGLDGSKRAVGKQVLLHRSVGGECLLHEVTTQCRIIQ